MPDRETLELQRICAEITFRVAAVCFHGTLPDDPVIVVRAIVSILPEDMPKEKVKEIVPHLYHAVVQYQDMQHCQFPL